MIDLKQPQLRPTLCIWDIGGHSNEYDDYLIKTKGRIARFNERIAPSVALVRKAGFGPTVIERAPGTPFGNSGFSLAEFAAIPYSAWIDYVRHITLPKAPLGNQPKQAPTIYQVYLGSSEFVWHEAWMRTLARLADTNIKAWFENVIDRGQAVARMAEARFLRVLAGREPVPDIRVPISDPWIVDETLLLNKGTDYLGRGTWPANWIALAPGQDRTLVLPDRDVTMSEMLDRRAAGWNVAVRAHRVRALVESAETQTTGGPNT